MIDTHCHLDTLEDALSAAREPGLKALITIGCDPEHAQSALELSEQLEHLFVVVGLHPTEANRDSGEVRKILETFMQQPKVVGIGETGIDYYWGDSTSKATQIASFEWQIECAQKRNLPIVIHARDKPESTKAFVDCANVLRNADWKHGILHCCSGDMSLLETGLELGFHVSFAGNLTYKNAHAIREAAQIVPFNRLLVETDAPYLSPIPNRGKRNRPSWVRYTLEVLANLRGLEFIEMEQITEENAKSVYKLPI